MHVSLTESSPVWAVQRLNVSCDHFKVMRKEAAAQDSNASMVLRQ